MNLYITKNKPQIKAPRVTPLEGVSTYALRGIRVRGVENPQGFGIDERRFNVLDSRLPVVVRGQKTGMELAKGRGQTVTPLMIETSASFETTEISEYTEKYSPSVISVPSVVDYSLFESEKTQER